MKTVKNKFRKLDSTNDNIKLVVILIMLVCIIASGFSVVTFVVSSRTDHNSRKISQVEKQDYGRLRDQALGLCIRLQDVRDSVNANSRALFILSSEIAESSRLSAKNKTISPTKDARKARLEISKIYQDIANKTRHIDPTNCEQAVDHPLSYKAPSPKHFSKKDLPKLKLPR